MVISRTRIWDLGFYRVEGVWCLALGHWLIRWSKH